MRLIIFLSFPFSLSLPSLKNIFNDKIWLEDDKLKKAEEKKNKNRRRRRKAI